MSLDIPALIREGQQEIKEAREHGDTSIAGFMAEKLGIEEREAEGIIQALSLGGLLLAPMGPSLAFEAVVVTTSLVAAKIIHAQEEVTP